MSDLPTAGAKLELDLSAWESNWSSAMDNADQLTQALDDISGSVDVEVNLDIPDTGELDDIQALDGEQISPEIDATESEDSKKIREGISFLATMKAIEVAINVVGTVLDFIKDIGALTVAPFLDVEDVVAKINAQTGGTGVADLGQLIRDLQGADLGSSVQQIGDTVIAAQQLGAPIKEAATAALTFTHTFQDEDPTTVLTTLNTLVQTGLVPNLQAAADLMTVAFQQGVNKGNDALQVVNANAQSWSDMGLNGTQALSAINSLQDSGVDSASDAAKMIQTLDDALTTAAATASSPQADALKTLGITNPKDSGQAMGADFIDGFAASFADLPADKQDLVSGVLFGKGGKKFTGALAGLTTQGGPFSDVVGAATDAANEIDNSLRGAIDDFVTEINKSLGDLLSSDAIDLPGKIDALKKGLQDALTVLQGGGTVGQALEIGLKVPGLEQALDTFIGNFERVIGNLEIAFLQIVASIQDVTGHGKEAAGTRATISDLSKKQLAFDLQLGNPDEIGTQVSQAIARGVSNKDAGDAINTALNETIASGNFGQGTNILQGLLKGVVDEGSSPDAVAAFNELAGKYVTNLQGGFDNALSAGDLNLLQKLITIPPNGKIPGLDDAVAAMKKQLSDAFIPQDTSGGTAGANPFMNMSAMFPGVGGKGGATGTQGGLLGSLTTDAKNVVDSLTEADTKIGGSLDHITTATQTTADSATTNMGTVSTAFDTAAVSADLADQGITLSLTGNTITASFEAVALAAQTSFPAVISWFERTTQAAVVFDNQVSAHIQHLLGLLHDLQFLSAQVATGVQAALTLGAGLPGAGNVTNNNVVVNNNVNSQASAAINGYTIGRSLRGG